MTAYLNVLAVLVFLASAVVGALQTIRRLPSYPWSQQPREWYRGVGTQGYKLVLISLLLAVLQVFFPSLGVVFAGFTAGWIIMIIWGSVLMHRSNVAS